MNRYQLHLQVLAPKKVLLDCYELQPRRLAAVNKGGYYQSYVYLECAADKPTGLYEMTLLCWKHFCPICFA